MLKQQQDLPSPLEWGWMIESGSFIPKWNSLPDMWKSTAELVFCKCKSQFNLCGFKCRCKLSNPPLPCTGLCLCEGDCDKV